MKTSYIFGATFEKEQNTALRRGVQLHYLVLGEQLCANLYLENFAHVYVIKTKWVTGLPRNLSSIRK